MAAPPSVRAATRLSAWLRANLFAGPLSAAITLAVLGLLGWLAPGLLDWAWLHAEFRPDAEACRALEHGGACWGVIAEKHRFILFGRYPFEAQWRPLAATAAMLAALVATAFALRHPRRVLALWLFVLPLFLVLMGGGVAGLAVVPSELWGGLPLTLLLTVVGLAAAFPLGLVLALGRLSPLPVPRMLCAGYIELVRGVPLVAVLFLASFLFPLFLPAGWTIDVLARVLVAIVLFAAAYLAETIRGGILAVGRGQWESAAALGFTRAQQLGWVILPQALRAAQPSLVNIAVGLFKDTSLVTIVSLYELTGSLALALAGDGEWRAFHLEGYLFIGAIYWAGCFALSRWSLRLERRLRPA
jgi:general L-amino acid transport system permease protein